MAKAGKKETAAPDTAPLSPSEKKKTAVTAPSAGGKKTSPASGKKPAAGKSAPAGAAKKASPSGRKSPSAGTGRKASSAGKKTTGTKSAPKTPRQKTSGRSGTASALTEAGAGKSLVIVESPTKAKTLTKILGPKYVVKSSVGHIRDLPKSRLAIDVDNDFAPEYILVKGKAKVKNELTGLAQKASRVILASDPDREGEAIAWHLCELLGIDPSSPCRVRFYEITPGAFREAVNNPEEVNMSKVEAQQARRILDRLVGYTLSPLLWKKIRRGLSAGRVQSVALALICAREREIREFVPRAYWLVTVTAAADDGRKYALRADSLDGKSLWKEGKSLLIDSEEVVEAILGEVEKFPLTVTDFKVRESLRAAPAPFKTSTLQQEAARRSSLSPRRTMSIAQELFEGVAIPGRGPTGLITYMRTDSLRIAPEAVEKCRAYIASSFEPSYLPEKENAYSAKGRSQDAHEAIRPTDVTITPESLEGSSLPTR